MIIFRQKTAISQYLQQQKNAGHSTGFVPTMGALHQGHISLVNRARKECSLVISSIFVNPTQFNDPSDFEKYPVTIERDIDMLENAGCDVLFLPAVQEMYPEGLTTADKHYDLGYLESILDGAFRPGHFQGVCRVVEKLLRITDPDKLYLGQKDYQQCMVITRLTELMNCNTAIVICNTERESDGLAMSSRNMRLNAAERQKAPLIYQSLLYIRQQVRPGSLDTIQRAAAQKLDDAGFKTDYIAIADAHTLQLIDIWDGKTPLVALVAAFIGEVRLIDNLLL